ncbi:MAG: YmaF family protein [Clostridiales bacterium]|nr:YmaF family protein [Clostridiales bacterium]MDU3241950.1 YmaF family protein [Clostridiales bacterium]
MSCNNKCMQTHVHEVLGSVRLAELNEDPHNHRFAGVTEEIIKVPGGHIHKFTAKTDFYEDHFHPICVTTGLQVKVGKCGDERHVHFIDSQTEIEDGHFHRFIASTLIENPIGD